MCLYVYIDKDMSLHDNWLGNWERNGNHNSNYTHPVLTAQTKWWLELQFATCNFSFLEFDIRFTARLSHAMDQLNQFIRGEDIGRNSRPFETSLKKRANTKTYCEFCRFWVESHSLFLFLPTHGLNLLPIFTKLYRLSPFFAKCPRKKWTSWCFSFSVQQIKMRNGPNSLVLS